MGLLQKLQEADEDVKKIYVIAGTCVMMSVIVFVWLTWFNDMNTLALVPGAQSGEQTAMATESGSRGGFSIWQSIQAGAGGIWESLRGLVGMQGEYIIKPKE